MEPPEEPLDELLKKAKALVDAMTPEQREEMLRKQAAACARSEAQWAREYREGKCKYD